MNNLAECLKYNFDWVNSLVSNRLTQDQKYSHISPEERQEVLNLIDRVKIWAYNAEQNQQTKPKWEDPVITVADILKHSK